MIKATFKDVGPIKNAELQLGDLTIIAGQNNTGKTYLVYTLYGFLNSLQGRIFSPRFLREKFTNGTKKLVDQIQATGRADMEFEEFKRLQEPIIRELSLFFSEKLLNQVFSASKESFVKAKFDIETKAELKDGKVIPIQYRKSNISMKCSREKNQVQFEFNSHEDVPSSMIAYVTNDLLWRIIQQNFPDPFILSAERFGISLFYKELDFTKNRLVEELQNLPDRGKRFDPFRFLEEGSARYAKPIKDNIDFTRDLPRIQRKKGELPIDKTRSVDTIMEGYYKAKNNEVRFISKRRKDNRFDIPLHLASSSARGVSDLYFYLKHIAKPGQLLIIDEPESHLSPTNQVLMARLLAFCVNSGLKVLITTHSDYLIKEINNLLMLNGDFTGKSEFLERYKKDYTKNDYLKPESVKVYICESGALHACSVDGTGIEMPVFDDAIDKINQISNELWLLRMPYDAQDD